MLRRQKREVQQGLDSGAHHTRIDAGTSLSMRFIRAQSLECSPARSHCTVLESNRQRRNCKPASLPASISFSKLMLFQVQCVVSCHSSCVCNISKHYQTPRFYLQLCSLGTKRRKRKRKRKIVLFPNHIFGILYYNDLFCKSLRNWPRKSRRWKLKALRYFSVPAKHCYGRDGKCKFPYVPIALQSHGRCQCTLFC